MNKIRNYLLTVILFLPIFLFANNNNFQSSSHVSGDVSGTWNTDTIFVDGNITVPQGELLTVESGTKVYFTGQYEFTVYGQLMAKGTETDTIFFFADSLGSDPDAQYYTPVGHWYGLSFKNIDSYGSPKSELEYCDFKYALTRDNNNWDNPDQDADSTGAPLKLYYSSNVSLSHIHISNCDAYIYGNIHLVHSSAELSNISINYTTGSGIAFRDNSNALLKNSTFSDKYIFINDSNPVLDSLIFENLNNTALRANNFGGTVTNTIFRNNTYTWERSGGAILLDKSSTAKFERVQFIENKSLYDGGWFGYGGAGYIHDSSPEFINCEFVGNVAYGSGSALAVLADDYYQPNVTTLQNCIFVNNKVIAQSGTIITGTGAHVKMINCTLADNSAPWDAAINNDSGSPNIITNSIIYGNGPNFDQQLSLHQSNHVLTYNIIQGDYYGKDTTSTNIHDVDPLFRDTSLTDYHLQSINCGYGANSPAIDAGDPEIGDFALDCASAGLGTSRSDIGVYGGESNRWDEDIMPACHFAGEVSGVWECEDIFIDGDITIPAGDTLRITSSVEWVHITGPYQIKVKGVLLAIGPENDHTGLGGDFIKFQGGVTEGNKWHGIFFNNLNDSGVGTSIIENCRFDYADKMDMTYQGGGAIAIYNSNNVEVRKSVFYANNAELGGAIYIENSDAHIEDCYFQLNGKDLGQNGETLAAGGGAMYIKDSNPYLHKVQFLNNQAQGGGAIVLDNSSPAISNILLAENKAGGIAGGIHCINGASPKIVNMTSANNIAETAGGTFYLNVNSNPQIINSIMHGNSKPEIYLDGGTVTVTYSIIDSGSTESYFGEGCLDENPWFVAGVAYRLANNSCDYSDGSTVVSNAIDAGHPDSLDALLSCDAGLGTNRADMGYYGGKYSEVVSAIEEEIHAQNPTQYKLLQNYPNPFNPLTTIQFSLPTAGHISLKVYNVLGEEIAVLIDGNMNAGAYKIPFNAAGFSSGVYFYRISVKGNLAGKSKEFTAIKKMILLK